MDIVAERNIMQQEETAAQAAVSESTMSRMGAVANFISLYQAPIIEFCINGPFNLQAVPNLNIDKIRSFLFDFELVGVMMSAGGSNGSSGTCELDIKWAAYNSNTFVSIFSTTPKFTPAAPAYDTIHDGDTKTGFTAPVLAKTQFDAKDKLRLDILQAPSGTVDGAGITLFWRPR